MLARLGREIRLLASSPPDGITVWPIGDSLHHLHAGMFHVCDHIYITLYHLIFFLGFRHVCYLLNFNN